MTPNQRDEALWKWEPLGTLKIRGRLSVADTSYFFDKPLILDLVPGDYQVSARYVLPTGHKHIAGLRVGTAEVALTRGTEIGKVSVDFGQLGVCDRDATEAAFDSLGDEGMPRYYDQLNTTALVEWVHLPGPVNMLVVRPGFGDGAYPVRELLRPDGGRGGIEIDCVGALT